MVLVEQNLEFVAGLSSRVLLIQKGTIVRSLAPENLHEHDIVEEFVGIGATAAGA